MSLVPRESVDRQGHWQASQSGLSIEQNFASVAGNGSAAEAIAPPGTPPLTETALSWPALIVDFSADVAPTVRR